MKVRETPHYQTHCANTGLSSKNPLAQAEWTEWMVGGKRREEGEEREGKGAVEGTRAFLFLFQGPGQGWVERKYVMWDLA